MCTIMHLSSDLLANIFALVMMLKTMPLKQSSSPAMANIKQTSRVRVRV